MGRGRTEASIAWVSRRDYIGIEKGTNRGFPDFLSLLRSSKELRMCRRRPSGLEFENLPVRARPEKVLEKKTIHSTFDIRLSAYGAGFSRWCLKKAIVLVLDPASPLDLSRKRNSCYRAFEPVRGCISRAGGVEYEREYDSEYDRGWPMPLPDAPDLRPSTFDLRPLPPAAPGGYSARRGAGRGR